MNDTMTLMGAAAFILVVFFTFHNQREISKRDEAIRELLHLVEAMAVKVDDLDEWSTSVDITGIRISERISKLEKRGTIDHPIWKTGGEPKPQVRKVEM
jgi:hypothetical protein